MLCVALLFGVRSTCHLASRATWDPRLRQLPLSVHVLGASADPQSPWEFIPNIQVLAAGSGGSIPPSFPSGLPPKAGWNLAAMLMLPLLCACHSLAFVLNCVPFEGLLMSALFFSVPVPFPWVEFYYLTAVSQLPASLLATSELLVNPSSSFCSRTRVELLGRSLKLLPSPSPRALPSSAQKKSQRYLRKLGRKRVSGCQGGRPLCGPANRERLAE